MGTVFVLVFFIGASSSNSSASMWSENFSSEAGCLEAGQRIEAMVLANPSSASVYSKRAVNFVCVRK